MKQHLLVLLVITTVHTKDGPLWRDVTAENLPPKESVGRNSMDIEAADMDGDGDLDLIVAQEFLPNKILRNEGAGKFVDASNLLPPLEKERLAQGANGHDSEDVSVADFNGDGMVDLVFASEDDLKFGLENVHEYYRGTATGNFVRVFDVLPDSEANAVAHTDLNGDGALELFLCGAGQDLLLINDGKGGFRDESRERLPREATTGQDAEFCDVDGDGDLDLVLALEGGHALWTNDGKAHFCDETQNRLPWIGALVEARKVTPCDIDGDDDLDLFFSHVGWQGRKPQDKLYLNDGKGVFRDVTSTWLPVEAETTVDAKFVDLDGDGDLDLVRANLGPLSVWEKVGSKFVEASSKYLHEAIVAQQLGLELADFDGDGVLDLYLGCLAGPNQDPRSFDRLMLGVKP